MNLGNGEVLGDVPILLYVFKKGNVRFRYNLIHRVSIQKYYLSINNLQLSLTAIIRFHHFKGFLLLAKQPLQIGLLSLNLVSGEIAVHYVQMLLE